MHIGFIMQFNGVDFHVIPYSRHTFSCHCGSPPKAVATKKDYRRGCASERIDQLRKICMEVVVSLGGRMSKT